ncbi:MAG: FAD-dependent oxidoreductase [Ruminococcaceae bacterium]|nr:FAD-dependent oxidoreductase [Oscillospiraceae bacterium]
MALTTQKIRADFCVVGGGLSGLCAAVAAARHGIDTVLMHERPMLGGNASSEIRMWVCGAQGEGNRETGLIEELQLSNLHYNPYKIYSLWDAQMYALAKAEPHLTLLLNTSCMDAETDGNRIVSVTGWQMTTQRFICVEADLFADCSGDSILAPLTGADFRIGREAVAEFGEELAVEEADSKTMGMSCLLQGRKLDHPVEFIAPAWAKKLTAEDLKRRRPHLERSSENFWYLELGGDRDSIGDSEVVRDELVALAYGMWDAFKNSGEFPDAANWQLDFLGFLPGKRESRRMLGDVLMTQNDIMAGGKFEDTVAFGGWPLDDHDPRGFNNPGKANRSVQPGSPYGIPYRTMYSRNMENLFFAGRNISMTHVAMSSSRVMATCSVIGQAVGTAAAIARKYETSPRGVYESHLDELQQTLMYDDCFLPWCRRTVSEAALAAELSCDDAVSGDILNLRSGIDRNNAIYGEGEQGFTMGIGASVEYHMDEPTEVSRVRVIFDSDLDRITLPGDKCERTHSMRGASLTPESPVMCMPKTLAKVYSLEIETENGWEGVLFETENLRRLVTAPVCRKVTGIRLAVMETWGADDVHIMSFDFE